MRTSQIVMPQAEPWKENPRLASGRALKQQNPGSVLSTEERGMPQPVSGLSVTSAAQTVGSSSYKRISIQHSISSNDQAFHHANVWVSGYLGNPNPQLMSGSTASPHSLLLPATGDKVSITVQSVGKDGSLLPLSKSPTASTSL